jgi:drug/metabolite transporter (DMT)-like permease
MRGDILLVAPLVDLLNRRKVRWYSWAALILTSVGLAIAVQARGNLNLPPLCWVVIGLYTLGYFGRLAVMTKTAKTGAPDELRRYFVEEQTVAAPVALILLVVLSLLDFGVSGGAVRLGFVGVWTSSALAPLAGLGVALFVISLLAVAILLDRRENTYCVPLERSASILAGIVAAFVLSLAFGQAPPKQAELIGAGLLVASIGLLTVGPRLGRVAPAALDSGADHGQRQS